MYNVAAMPAEPSPESVAVGAPAGAAFAAGAEPVGASPPPRTEQQLNSPSPLALSMLGVVFLATFVPWLMAKVACNVREAPLRQPPELSVELLSRQPKDAALELQQRVAGGRYREAAELARGDAARELLEADGRCQSDPKPCEALRAHADQVVTRAVLVGRGSHAAEARAESQVGAAGQVERFVMRLEADGGRWYVVSRQPYPGELTTPIPVIHVNPAPGVGLGAAGAPAAPGVPPVAPVPAPSAPTGSPPLLTPPANAALPGK